MAEKKFNIYSKEAVTELINNLNSTLNEAIVEAQTKADNAQTTADKKTTLDEVRELLKSLNIEDQILEYENRDAFPESGNDNALYLDLSDNHIWRWTGSTYIDVSASSGHLTLGETATTAYAGNKGKANADAIKALQTLTETINATLETKAPKAHASTETTYGIGTATQYGHVKLFKLSDYATYNANDAGATTPSFVSQMLSVFNTETILPKLTSELSKYATNATVNALNDALTSLQTKVNGMHVPSIKDKGSGVYEVTYWEEA